LAKLTRCKKSMISSVPEPGRKNFLAQLKSPETGMSARRLAHVTGTESAQKLRRKMEMLLSSRHGWVKIPIHKRQR
jgi:hypothetical protein